LVGLQHNGPGQNYGD